MLKCASHHEKCQSHTSCTTFKDMIGLRCLLPTNLVPFPANWKFLPLLQCECHVLYTSHGTWMFPMFSIVIVFHQTHVAGSSTPSWCNIMTSTPGIPLAFHCPHFTLGKMITSPYHHYGMQNSQTKRQIIKHAFTNWFYRICILDWESIYKQPF